MTPWYAEGDWLPVAPELDRYDGVFTTTGARAALADAIEAWLETVDRDVIE